MVPPGRLRLLRRDCKQIPLPLAPCHLANCMWTHHHKTRNERANLFSIFQQIMPSVCHRCNDMLLQPQGILGVKPMSHPKPNFTNEPYFTNGFHKSVLASQTSMAYQYGIPNQFFTNEPYQYGTPNQFSQMSQISQMSHQYGIPNCLEPSVWQPKFHEV